MILKLDDIEIEHINDCVKHHGKVTNIKLTHKLTGLFVERSGIFHYPGSMEEIYTELKELLERNNND